MNPPARTSVILVPQRGQASPPLSWTARKSRTCFSNVGGTRTRRMSIACPRVAARRAIERVDLLVGQARSLPEWQQAGGVQDLVAIGIADARHECLVAQQVLELARMSPDPLPPDLEGQRRVVGIGTLLRAAETGHRPVDPRGAAGRPCPSASDRGTGPRPARRPRGTRRAGGPRRGIAGERGPALRTPTRRPSSTDASPLARPSWNRPVNIGLTAIASPSRAISRNLPRRRIEVTR